MKVYGSSREFAHKIASNMVRDAQQGTEQLELAVHPHEVDAYLRQEALDHAEAYWMMGRNWDEIEVILEDLEFPETVVEETILLAQRKAQRVIEKGPFQSLREGQLVKLKNGYAGHLVAISPKYLSIDTGEEQLRVDKDQLDVAHTAKLTEAFQLRETADKITAQKDYLVPERPAEMIPAPQEGGERFLKPTIKKTPGAPSGWGGDVYPHISEVQQVDDTVAAMLDQIEAAEQEMVGVKEELKIANQMANEVREKRKQLEKREFEVAKQIFAIIGQQNEALQDMNATVFQKYKNKLVGLRSVMIEEIEEVGVAEELETLKGVLELNHPRIFKSVMTALDEYKETNATITEKLEKSFAMFPPARKKTGQLLQKIKDWASKVWNRIKEVTSDLYTLAFPIADESVAAIDEFTGVVGKQASRLQAKMAMEKLNELSG